MIHFSIKNTAYSISKNIITLTVDFELFDDAVLDAGGNPIILDVKTISVSQNILNPEAINIVSSKIINEVQSYLERTKANLNYLQSTFGTINPEEILQTIQTGISQTTDSLVSSIFGGE